MTKTCSFCAELAIDQVVVEAGNNAETDVVIHCCKTHLDEMEENCAVFEKKYGDRIEELAGQKGL